MITIRVFLANGLAAMHSYYYGLGNVVDGATYSFFFFFLDFFLYVGKKRSLVEKSVAVPF